MAKVTKVEDYWRQNNVESLLKEITHVLAQKMPPDPAVAITQYLQKKFPRSFKTPTDGRDDVGATAKATSDTIRSPSVASPRSHSNNDSMAEAEQRRRASTLSQGSNPAIFQSTGSAFTNLLTQRNSSFMAAPEVNLRNLVFANRIGQQVVKLGKNIRSDNEILEDEILRPTKIYKETSDSATQPAFGSLRGVQPHEEPSAEELLKMKQHRRTEQGRRHHREKLANIAKQVQNEEQRLMSGFAVPPDQIPSKEMTNDGDEQLRVHSEASGGKAWQRTAIKSKAEEEVLNDENIFHPRTLRTRQRQRNKALTSRTDAFNLQRTLTGRRGTIQGCVCKVCGTVMTIDDLEGLTQPANPEPTPGSVTDSQAAVDDWFQSSANESESQSMVVWSPDEITPLPKNENPFHSTLFRPIALDTLTNSELRSADGSSNDHEPPFTHLSESNTFTRTASPFIRRSPLARRTPSPAIKSPSSVAVISPRVRRPSLSRTTPSPGVRDPLPDKPPRVTAQSPLQRSVPASPLPATLAASTEQPESDWDFNELAQAPDQS